MSPTVPGNWTRCANRPETCARQNGVALLILLVIIVLATTGLLLNSLNRATITTERDRITAEALAQAKEALITYAIKGAVASQRPGSLPCPDTKSPSALTAGEEEGACSINAIGRLPWKTLGLGDLRDGSGERLWYALSDNFRSSSSVALNSDTLGQLTITGANPASNVVAIIFSPGSVIGSQNRSATPTVLCTTTNSTIAPDRCAANYLEGENSISNITYVAAATSATFNDRLLTISSGDLKVLFAGVEKVVAKRFKDDWLVPALNTYFSSWGTYPFAASFANPATSNFVGAVGVNSGLLPMGVSVIPTWAAVPAVSFSGGSGIADCQLTNGDATNSRWRCDLSGISGTPTISITGVLNQVGRSLLWQLHDLSDVNQVRVRINNDGVNRLTTNAAISPAMNATIGTSVPLNAAGAATVVFTGRVSSQITRIELRDMVAASLPAWFTDSNWQRVMVYAISPGYAPGGGNACVVLPGTPSCLTVNGSGGGSDKRAIIVMAGAVVGSQVRPSGTLANYFEGENATPADFVYENQIRSGSFNDHVLVIAP